MASCWERDVHIYLCAVMSAYGEYKAVITILIPMRIMVVVDHERGDDTTHDSPVRLIVGGIITLLRTKVCLQALCWDGGWAANALLL